jgi:hypothetical protein
LGGEVQRDEVNLLVNSVELWKAGDGGPTERCVKEKKLWSAPIPLRFFVVLLTIRIIEARG